MTHERLATAAELLDNASELAKDDDVRTRLSDQADSLATAAERDRDLDHGRLARITHILDGLAEDADGEKDVQQAIRDAKEAIVAYRETVEGV